ncbi:hypothetical protein KQX54_010197, partial [Cotesia glomerata]
MWVLGFGDKSIESTKHRKPYKSTQDNVAGILVRAGKGTEHEQESWKKTPYCTLASVFSPPSCILVYSVPG